VSNKFEMRSATSPLALCWLTLCAVTIVWDEVALSVEGAEPHGTSRLPCMACTKFAEAIEMEFKKSPITQGGQGSNDMEVSATSADDAGISVENEAALPSATQSSLQKMRTALRDADRMEREAMASDILEAACDHMVQLTHTSSPTSIIPENGHRLQLACHSAVDDHEERLKGALMFPAGNTTANANANATPSEEPAFPVMDSVWLCQDVLGSCPKFIEGAEHGGWNIIGQDGGVQTWLITISLLLGGIIFMQHKPWTLLCWVVT